MDKKTILLTFVLILAGCVKEPGLISVSVDSSERVKELGSERMTFMLMPCDDTIAGDDSHFVKYAKVVERALEQKGLQRVYAADAADAVVYLSYGIQGPETKQIPYKVPVWGEIGIIPVTPAGNPKENPTVWVRSAGYETQVGIVGSHDKTREVQLFTRQIALSAYDLKLAGGQHDETALIWRTQLTSTGVWDDLDKVFPLMIAAAMNDFGTNKIYETTPTFSQLVDRVEYLEGIRTAGIN